MIKKKGRSTIIFGNGLGRSLDNNYFQLSSGIEHVWNNADYLDDPTKRLINSTLNNNKNLAMPEGESDLDKIHVAISATELLTNTTTNAEYWLTEPAQSIPITFKKFIHDVAIYFQRSAYELPDSFATPLVNYIRNSRSHVATLNYDNLLYDSFKHYEVLRGYSDVLIDGYLKTGFDNENLNRNYPDKHGWYMHLHGSPLFIDNKKMMGPEREYLAPNEKCHIVLSHIRHKPMIIASSAVLTAYWSRLNQAINESSTIILFGYSGEDEHLNDLIKSFSEKKIFVVEWIGNDHSEEHLKNAENLKSIADARISYWKNQLGERKIGLQLLQNILDFEQWDANCLISFVIKDELIILDNAH